VWWDRFGDDTPTVGVGVTTSQIADPDLVGRVGAALARSGVPPRVLCIGIPTAALAVEDGDARDNIAVLISMGVTMVLGDAGVAPVELTLLDEWPITAVQIAVPLVRALAAIDPDSRLARTTGALVRSLDDTGLPVVAAGVRTAREIEWWSSVGARVGSGPYYGEPADAEETERKIAEHPWRR
jgi:EAL domain-containing protein (putative c-di-GMP-specific phosphodiesterase class I)